MSNINFTAKEIISSVTKKLDLREVETTKEGHGSFYLDGKLEFRVTLPNEHGGNRTVSPGMFKHCRETVHLTTSQFSQLVGCQMTSLEYVTIIRAKRDKCEKT